MEYRDRAVFLPAEVTQRAQPRKLLSTLQYILLTFVINFSQMLGYLYPTVQKETLPFPFKIHNQSKNGHSKENPDLQYFITHLRAD